MPSFLEKIQGSLFGCAIGDALGWPVEFNSSIVGGSGFVKDLPENPEFTDDTQMTIAVIRGLINFLEEVKTSNVDEYDESSIDLAAEFIVPEFILWLDDPVTPTREPGSACLHGCKNLKSGMNWKEAGKPDAKGCGTAMRSAPYGWIYDSFPRMKMSAEHAKMTHLSDEAMASAAAITAGVSYMMRCEHYYSPAGLCLFMKNSAVKYGKHTAFLIEKAVLQKEQTPDIVLDKWRGWTGAEAVAASLYCVIRNENSFEDAVLEAVNSPGDSDSLGAITGALMGAKLGINAIRSDWVNRIERRDEMFELCDRFHKASL